MATFAGVDSPFAAQGSVKRHRTTSSNLGTSASGTVAAGADDDYHRSARENGQDV